MAEIKLTKNGLRDQQLRLTQLERYLPTLQLKKAMLQAEVQRVRQLIQEMERLREEKCREAEAFSLLLTSRTSIDPFQVVKIRRLNRRYENVAGVEIPHLEGVEFEELAYSLFETAPWVDQGIIELRALAVMRERLLTAREQQRALEKEWREVSIRVNLFEKILIPRALENIRIIKVFLGDQQMDAVSRAKVAKKKRSGEEQLPVAMGRERGGAYA